MELESILTLIQAVSESRLKSFQLEEGNLKISLKKDDIMSKIAGAADAETEMVLRDMPNAEPVVITKPSDNIMKSAGEFEHIVKSPLVGTFYSSPSPDAEAFVKAGDHVKKGQILGIIEAMKLMNEIECDYDGVVEAILIENEQVVEFGQPLFRIK